MSHLMSALAIVALLYLAICVAGFLLQRQLVYHPFRQIVATPDDLGLEYRELRLRSPDGVEFQVWDIPASRPCAYAICFHGNADNISTNIDSYRLLHELQVYVFAVEYRGYGSSTGTPSEDGISTDLRTLSDYIRTIVPQGSGHVVAVGHSLGGAVAVKFAAVHPVAGLILESTFNRMAEVGQRAFPFLPVSLLLREKFDSEALLQTIDCPVLVIHSVEDEVVPYDLGRKLYDSVRGEKKFVEIEGSHNTRFQTSERIIRQEYAEFFKKIAQRRTPAS